MFSSLNYYHYMVYKCNNYLILNCPAVKSIQPKRRQLYIYKTVKIKGGDQEMAVMIG